MEQKGNFGQLNRLVDQLDASRLSNILRASAVSVAAVGVLSLGLRGESDEWVVKDIVLERACLNDCQSDNDTSMLIHAALPEPSEVTIWVDTQPEMPTISQPTPSEHAHADIPPNYLELYQASAVEQNIDWSILAGIGKIETDHGRYPGPGVTEGQNFHGCCAGPMQFFNNEEMAPDYDLEETTWAKYGQDENGSGIADVYDPEDAIPAAARYLADYGLPHDVAAALWEYNRSVDYRNNVLAAAAAYVANEG